MRHHLGTISLISSLAVWLGLGGCAATSNFPPTSPPSRSYASESFPVHLVDRSKFDRRYHPTIVAAPAQLEPGAVLVDTVNRHLYLIEPDGMARRYGVAVGGSGHNWSGEAVVGRMTRWPAWRPTEEMRAAAPLPVQVAPGPHNPLGARALYLFRNGKDTLYRIHGTSEPWTIGTAASSGCIRMLNEDVIDLFERVRLGARVVVR